MKNPIARLENIIEKAQERLELNKCNWIAAIEKTLIRRKLREQLNDERIAEDLRNMADQFGAHSKMTFEEAAAIANRVLKGESR